MRELWHRESDGTEILRSLRRRTHADLRFLRLPEPARTEVLRCLRNEACGCAGRSRAAAAVVPRAAPTTERRLVSVLFADLVGFTTFSESRDSEEVRDLLSRYFDESRQIVSRYGGVVEKFIGDAVMAVWGTPIAHEDDAERAVRASLELTAVVRSLGEEVGAADLRARAGVLTGEAAVAPDADREGMVAGRSGEHRLPDPVGRDARRRPRRASRRCDRPTT